MHFVDMPFVMFYALNKMNLEPCLSYYILFRQMKFCTLFWCFPGWLLLIGFFCTIFLQRLSGASLLIFANKQDIQGSLSPDEIAKVRNLHLFEFQSICLKFDAFATEYVCFWHERGLGSGNIWGRILLLTSTPLSSKFKSLENLGVCYFLQHRYSH